MIKKAGAISLIFILLIATAGVTISKHYCGEKLASVSLFSSGGCGCGDEEMNANCCHNEVEFFQVDEDYVTSAYDFSFNQKLATAIIDVCFDFYFGQRSRSSDYLTYKPPLIERDIPMLVQSFLI